MPIQVPGNVYYNGYMATRELLRAVERAGTTNNIKVIKELESLKVPARDRMQHFDAYMNPATHQMQQTIYMATLQRPSRRRRTTSSRSSADVPAEGGRGRGRAGKPASSSPTSRRRRRYEDVTARCRIAARRPRLARAPCDLDLSTCSAPGQRRVARPAVRADRAGLHADRRRDGDDQPGARLVVRARACTSRCAHARRSSPLPPDLRKRGSRCRSAGAMRSRWSSRRCSSASFGMLLELLHAPHLRPDPLYGLLLTFGAALVIEELIRLVWGSTRQAAAGARRDLGRVPARRPDLRRATASSRAASPPR